MNTVAHMTQLRIFLFNFSLKRLLLFWKDGVPSDIEEGTCTNAFTLAALRVDDVTK